MTESNDNEGNVKSDAIVVKTTMGLRELQARGIPFDWCPRHKGWTASTNCGKCKQYLCYNKLPGEIEQDETEEDNDLD